MTSPLDYESIQIGDQIPPFVRTTHFTEWNRYAAVNDEFIPIHMDDEAGRAAGNENGAFGMGNLRLAYLVNMLRAWIGDDGEIRSLTAKYRSMNQKGDELRCIGEVTGKEIVDGVALIHLDVDVVDQNGNSTTPGQATVALG
ncbi:MaoC/PaaZ C-terminal domain-containing protein [Mycolicibacterium sp. 120270]|uniref:MaoC/PaaZ C-terminal domain-containing protein n=1 Tax=Mycolicibacterium sp. 120270 TaxID=3090600 RepID=UPI00299EA7A2|nr:MaoC/PaaZ C-terminal domain-containing protein [Mycolicibacterium sp. 120270]MDX1882225.1 MaoC/PaaZ C-terminal domain-containing protein [Mycolicibacterium sp. 120270]